MAITEHSAATEQTFDSNDLTFNYDLPSGGSDVMLVVFVSAEKQTNITNVDWDNAGSPVAMTEAIESQGNDKSCAIYTLKNPSARGNLQIRVRAVDMGKSGIVVKGYAGVDAADDTDSDTGTSTPDITIPNTVTGSLCVDCLAAETGTAPTADSGQTIIHDGNSGSHDYGTSQEPAGASSTAMGWGIESGKKFAYCGLELTEVVEILNPDIIMTVIRNSQEVVDQQQLLRSMNDNTREEFLLKHPKEKYTTWKSFVPDVIDVIHTTDILVKVLDSDVIHTTDILVQIVDNDLTHSTDVLVFDPQLVMTLFRNTDDNIKQQQLVNRKIQNNHEQLLKSLHPFEEYTNWKIAQGININRTHTTDILIQVIDNDLTHTTDTLIQVVDNDLTHTTDVLVQIVDNDLTHTTDTLIKVIDNDLTHSTDILIHEHAVSVWQQEDPSDHWELEDLTGDWELELFDPQISMGVIRGTEENLRQQQLVNRFNQQRAEHLLKSIQPREKYITWASVIGAVQVEKTHTTDTLIQVVDNDVIHTTDLLVQVIDNDRTHTTDILVQVVDIDRTHTTDVLVQVIDNDVTHSTDVFVEDLRLHMVVIRNTQENLRRQMKANRTDDNRRRVMIKTLQPFVEYTSWRFVVGLDTDIVHSTDTLVQVVDNDLIHTTDILVKVIDNDVTHTTDVLVLEELDLTHSTDVFIIDIPFLTIVIRNTQENIRRQRIANRLDDERRRFIIKTLHPFVEYTSWRFVIGLDTDVVHTTDTLVQVIDNDLTHTTDILIKVIDNDRTHTTDILVFQEIELTHSTDIFVQVVPLLTVPIRSSDETLRQQLGVNRLNQQRTERFLKAIQPREKFTTWQPVIEAETNTVTHTTDILVQAVNDVTHTTDVLVQVIDNDLTHTTDVLVQEVDIDVVHSTDTFVFDVAIFSTTVIRNTQETLRRQMKVNRREDNRRRTMIKTLQPFVEYTSWRFVVGLDTDVIHTTDVLIQVIDNDVTHTTDVLVKVIDNDLTYTTDVLVQVVDNDVVHTTDVLIQVVDNDVTHSTDVFIIDPVVLFMTNIRNVEENLRQQELVNRLSQSRHELILKSLHPFVEYTSWHFVLGLDTDVIHITDTLVQVVDNDLTYTTDTLVQVVDNDLIHTTDVLIQVIDNDLVHSTDVFVKIDPLVFFMTVIRNTQENLRRQVKVDRMAGNRIKKMIKSLHPFVEYTSWRFVIGLDTDVIHTTDTLIQVVDNDLVHTTDTLIQVIDNDLTHTTDTLIQVIDNDLIHTTDVLVLEEFDLIHSTDVFVFDAKIAIVPIRSTQDNLRQQMKVDRLANARKKLMIKSLQPFVEYTSWRFVVGLGTTRTHSTDTLVQVIDNDLIHTTDTLIQVIDNDLIHTTDVLVQVVDNDVVHTTDVLVQQIDNDIIHSTDIFVFDPQVVMTVIRNTQDNLRLQMKVDRLANKRRKLMIKSLHPFVEYTSWRFVVGLDTDRIHTTDTLVQVVNNDLIQTTDTLIKVIDNDLTHTTDVLVKVLDNDRVHTTDILVQEINNVVHSTDVFIFDPALYMTVFRNTLQNQRQQQKVDRLINARKKLIIKSLHPFVEYTSWRFIVGLDTDRTHTTDTLVQVIDNDLIHTTDLLVQVVDNDLTHTTDLLVFEEVDLIHTTDILVKVVDNDLTHTTDVLVQEIFDLTHSTDVFVFDPQLTMTVIRNTQENIRRQMKVDRMDNRRRKLMIKSLHPFVEYTSWRFVVGLDTDVTHTTDTLVQVVDNDLTHTTDILIKVIDNDLTHTTDTLVQVVDNDLTHTTDILVQEIFDITHSTDIFIQDVALLMTIIRNTNENIRRQELVNKFIQQRNQRMLKALQPFEEFTTWQPIIPSIAVDEIHTTDILVKQVDNDAVHTTDILVQVIDNDLTHTTDILVLEEFDIIHTTDVLVQATIDVIHTTDILVQVVDNDRTHTTDILVFEEQELTHSTDILVQVIIDKIHTTDVLVQATIDIIHTTDVLVQQIDNDIVHTTDTLVQVINNDVIHTTDTLVQVEFDVIHTTDVLVQIIDNDLVHTTDIFISLAAVVTVTHSTDTLVKLLAIRKSDVMLRDRKTDVTIPTRKSDIVLKVR